MDRVATSLTPREERMKDVDLQYCPDRDVERIGGRSFVGEGWAECSLMPNCFRRTRFLSGERTGAICNMAL